MKGGKVAVFDLTKSKPADAELMELMLGSTGNLRAPVIVRGGTVLVGFNEDVYGDELG
jgi:arsenate reductase-like glutaredoxin family protein